MKRLLLLALLPAALSAQVVVNATKLQGGNWAAPGQSIGSTTPQAGFFTGLGIGTLSPLYTVDISQAGPAQLRLIDTASGGGALLFGASNSIVAGGSFLSTTGQLDILPGGVVNISRATATNPTALAGSILHLTSPDGAANVLDLDTFAGIGSLFFRRANGTSASPSALSSGDRIGQVAFSGYGATGYSVGRAQIAAFAAENWTDSAQGTEIHLVVTPTGSTSIATAVLISSNQSTQFFGATIFLTHTPSSASDTGVAGTITYDASYVYVCTATNTWKRVAIATW